MLSINQREELRSFVVKRSLWRMDWTFGLAGVVLVVQLFHPAGLYLQPSDLAALITIVTLAILSSATGIRDGLHSGSYTPNAHRADSKRSFS